MDYDRPLFFYLTEYAAAADRDVVDMVQGNPDWDPPVALREGLRAFADRGHDAFQYPPSEGVEALRTAIADRHSVDRESVVITNGATESNHLAMACGLQAFPGDTVLLTDPTYPYYPARASMLGARVRRVPVELDGTLDAAAVREAADDDVSVIQVNTPNNPTGAVYDESTMRDLVAVAEEYDALLVSDEVYEELDLSGRFASALQVESEHRWVTNGFSKSMAATGMRVGYALVPEPLVETVRTRHMLTNIAVSTPTQHAALHALRETPDDYYERSRATLRERVETFTAALDDAGATYTTPNGAFYVMVRFDGFPGSLENAKQLIDEAGVAGMPGETFGRSRDDWFRFALATPRVTEAAQRLERFFY